MNRRQSVASRRRLMKAAVLCVVALVALIVAIYFGGQYFQRSSSTDAFGSLEGRFEEDKPITWQGRQYKRNLSVHSYLMLGVDKQQNSVSQSLSAFRGGGQCDFLMLMIIDSQHKVVRRLQIDRDTMTEITVLGILGNDLGTSKLQICLAHSYGDGKEQSCQYAVEAVQRLLYGIEINGYFSLNMDGIATFNDLLGGVTVTLQDDFSAQDPAMVPGATLTLQGRQAELFVRGRMSVGDGTNASRMVRQQQYMGNAMNLVVAKVRENGNFMGTLFDGLEAYTVTDISRGKMINEANKAAQYQAENMLTLKGEHRIGEDGFVEYHVDKDALTQLVLDVFYDPVP